ncbi:MAG: oligopeptide transport system substrate-binding protein [Halioglobus sp.]|jgi:oligopeptide transport system substrate-binding protein
MAWIKHISRCLGILLLAMLSGCMQGEPNVAAGNRDGILHIGNGAEPQSLDPHVMTSATDANITGALFEGLVAKNPYTLAIEPGVAQRWTFSEDLKTITFYLRKNARWSNGETLDARDFVYSLRRILTPAMANPVAYLLYPISGAEAFNRGQTTNVHSLGVRLIDHYTLEIKLNNPTPYFLELLAGYYGYPVPKATIEAFGKTTDRYSRWTRAGNLVGNGPFTLKSWRMQRDVTVVKNPHYWDAEQVALNSVVFHAVESPLIEEKMFRVGQLHYTTTVPLSKINGYRAQPKSPYHQKPMVGTYYYMFNIDRPPVDDVRVRRALALSVNRQQLIDKLLLGTAIASPALVPMNLIPGYEPPDLLAYNPEAAKQLLAEAGYPNGKGWPGLTLMFNTSEDHRKVAVAVQQMWKKQLNIEVTLVNQEWKVYLNTTQLKNFQLARMGWIAGIRDPALFLDGFTTDSGTNRTGFSNKRYDELILDKAPAAIDPVKRLALLRQAESIFIEQVPLIPFYTYNSKHLVQPSVHGAPANVANLLNYKYISLDSTAKVFEYKD